MRHFWILVLTVGCQQEPTQMLPWERSQDGSRLWARRVLDPATGAAQRLDFVDRLTGQSCRFLPLNPQIGDELRCLPHIGATMISLDEDCSSLYVEAYAPNHPWVVAAGYAPNTGVVRLGAQVPAARRFIDTGARCLPFESSSPVYEVAEHWEDSQIPSGVLVAQNIAPNLVARRYQGTDGTSFIHSFWDNVTQDTCLPALTEAGGRCAPLTREPILDEGYRDAGCEQLAIASYGQLTVGRATRMEGGAEAYYRFTPVPDGTPVGRRLPSGECVVENWHFGGRARLYFANLYPPSEWPEVGLSDAVGPRLISRYAALTADLTTDYTALDGPEGLFLDAAEDIPCGPAWLDGNLRCLPKPPEGARTWLQAFEDPNCQNRVAVMQEGFAPPATWLWVEGDASPQGASLPNIQTYAVGEAIQTQIYVLGADNTCVAQVSFGQVYRLTMPLAPGSFAPLVFE